MKDCVTLRLAAFTDYLISFCAEGGIRNHTGLLPMDSPRSRPLTKSHQTRYLSTSRSGMSDLRGVSPCMPDANAVAGFTLLNSLTAYATCRGGLDQYFSRAQPKCSRWGRSHVLSRLPLIAWLRDR